MTLTTLLVCFITEFRFSLIEYFIQLFKSLVNQDIRNHGHLIYKNTRVSFKAGLDIILLTWIISSCFLTHCFVSELLTIYSPQKSVPLVQSLDDIISNKHLLIGSPDGLKHLETFRPEQYINLNKRYFTKNDYPASDPETNKLDVYNQLYLQAVFKNIIQDVSKGKIIILGDTDYMYYIYNVYKNYHVLYVAKNKYLPEYYVNTIDIGHPYKNEIIDGYIFIFKNNHVNCNELINLNRLVTLFEAGLNSIDASLIDVCMDIWGKVYGGHNGGQLQNDAQNENDTTKPIDLKAMFKEALSVYFLGIIAAVFVLFVEMIFGVIYI